MLKQISLHQRRCRGWGVRHTRGGVVVVIMALAGLAPAGSKAGDAGYGGGASTGRRGIVLYCLSFLLCSHYRSIDRSCRTML